MIKYFPDSGHLIFTCNKKSTANFLDQSLCNMHTLYCKQPVSLIVSGGDDSCAQYNLAPESSRAKREREFPPRAQIVSEEHLLSFRLQNIEILPLLLKTCCSCCQ